MYVLNFRVKSSYPNEKTNVNSRQKEVQEMWEKVKVSTKDI